MFYSKYLQNINGGIHSKIMAKKYDNVNFATNNIVVYYHYQISCTGHNCVSDFSNTGRTVALFTSASPKIGGNVLCYNIFPAVTPLGKR